MKPTSFRLVFTRAPSGEFAPSGMVNPQGSRGAALSEEQLKARALQRWENEGGRLPPGAAPGR